MERSWLDWAWALGVMALTGVLVVLDLTDGPVHRYWARHSFTSSVLSGLLVLLLTVLIVDRVTRVRQIRNQSRATAAQAAVILAQAGRTADAITGSHSADDRDAAEDELRTYTQMLLTSSPILIGAAVPRTFLEAAQRLAGQMYYALRDAEAKPPSQKSLDDAMAQLRTAGAPLVAVLNRDERAAVSTDQTTP
jgi:hypothetical protein